MEIKDIKTFGVIKGIFKDSDGSGVNFLLPIFKRFFNYLKMPWIDICCNKTSEAGAPVGYVGNSLKVYNPVTEVYDNVGINFPEYANNAAALTASLAVGSFYRTGDVLKVVHL